MTLGKDLVGTVDLQRQEMVRSKGVEWEMGRDKGRERGKGRVGTKGSIGYGEE